MTKEKEKTAASVFATLNEVNVNEHAEKKDNLTYLTWAWAWAEVKKRFPDAAYRIYKNEQGQPYFEDPNLGYMVYTEVTIEGQTHEMWLPVMDGANRAMKREPYKVRTKYNEFTVNAATMFDVNKAIMRCLVKNLAMHGLGLYIYAGEDLPDTEPAQIIQAPTEPPKTYREQLMELANSNGILLQDVAAQYGLVPKDTEEHYRAALEQMKKDLEA